MLRTTPSLKPHGKTAWDDTRIFVQNHGLHKKGIEFIGLLCKAPLKGGEGFLF